MKQETGILARYHGNGGNALSPQLESEVTDFYEMMKVIVRVPRTVSRHERNCVTVWGRDGKSFKHQKRQVLSNLKELPAAWSESHLIWTWVFLHLLSCHQSGCVLAGASGTHSVHVCTYHQSSKLIVEACWRCDIHALIRYSVCSNESESCMMGQCKECLGRPGLIDYLSQCDELSDTEEITNKQWISTDQTTLVTLVERNEDFIENVATRMKRLTHQFHSKIPKFIHGNT